MDHTVRLATTSDLGDITDLANWAALHTTANFAVAPEPLEAWRASYAETARRFPWLVASSQDGDFLGFAKASPWKGRCAYNWSAETTVYVQPDHHGEGIGRLLCARLLEILDAQGYRSLLAGIALPNEASVRLHEAVGFKRAATFERIGFKWGRWHDVGYWQRTICTADDSEPGPVREVGDVADVLVT